MDKDDYQSPSQLLHLHIINFIVDLFLLPSEHVSRLYSAFIDLVWVRRDVLASGVTVFSRKTNHAKSTRTLRQRTGLNRDKKEKNVNDFYMKKPLTIKITFY